MPWRTLFLGLFVGFGIGCGVGWFVFGRGEDPAAIPVLPATPYETEATPPATSLVTPPTLQGAAGAERAPPSADEAAAAKDLAQTIASGTAAEVKAAASGAEPPFGADAVAAARKRFPGARADGDWRLFEALLEVLGRADIPEADAALVVVLGDETLVFPEPMGNDFHRWLAGSQVPGIAEAARRRLKRYAADGESSWIATHGWVDLVADHGTEEDIAWLLLEGDPRKMRDDGAVAVAKSKSPAAIQWMTDALVLPVSERGHRAGWGSYPQTLGAFVRAHGEDAHDVVAEIVDRTLAGESILVNMKVKQLFGMYGRTVPKERAAEAVRLLQGLDTEAAQISALTSVLAMRRRGLDVSGLEHLLEAPLVALRRMAGGEEDAGPGSVSAYQAMYAVEYNRALWSEEAAEALEAAGRALMGKTPAAANMLEVAKEVRAGLRSPWREE